LVIGGRDGYIDSLVPRHSHGNRQTVRYLMGLIMVEQEADFLLFFE
jgi:hypothetical protein